LQYNPFHDQLVLSSGTDSIANLWRMSTISSAPLLTNDADVPDDDASETAGPNARIARHEHVDAIYSSCWSSADAWVYLTLGYDGKVQCHSVPSKEKYKILL
jgi:WD40 repeat protein